ncbi:MAG: GNAT family N-acetyltransferase [Spirochaetes bacterium]|nr:GNAT family N-acetyltransferase [Spirochaetota bacterium]
MIIVYMRQFPISEVYLIMLDKIIYNDKNLEIRMELVQDNNDIPYDLLLLADETVESIDKYIHECVIYLLMFRNKPVGVCAVCEISPGIIEIKNIAVVEELRGRGFGKLMLNSVIDNAERNGYERIIIGTGDAGIRQINLYKKCGFEIYDKKKNFFIDNFPEPIYENGIQLIDMVMLKRDIVKK